MQHKSVYLLFCKFKTLTECFKLNFSKEQSMLPEDDRMIETCRSVLSVLA